MGFVDKLKDPKWRREYLKFVLVGVATAVLDFAVMALVIYASRPSSYGHNYFNAIFNVPSDPALAPKTATVVMATGLGFFISILANYLCSVYFVYRYGNVGKSKSGFVKFIIFALIGLAFHTVGEVVGYNLLKLNLWLVKLVLSAAVFVFNYVTRKHFIFNLNLIVDEDNTIEL